MNYIVCFGKQPLPDNSPDWILASRLELTAATSKKYPEHLVILSGGKSVYLEKDSSQPAEAEVMARYLQSTIGPARIIIETESRNTAEQLLQLTRKYFNGPEVGAIILISDELHLPRVRNLFQGMFRAQDKVEYLAAPVKIGGNYYKCLQEFSNAQMAKEEEVVALLPKYDLDAYTRYFQAYLKMRAQDKDPLHVFAVKDVLHVAGLPYGIK